MPPNESVDKVGLGVDLLGGAEVLTLLRAIRQEMQGIASLAGRGQGKGDIYGPSSQARFEQELKQREAAELASIKRVARARAEANRPISSEEIESGAQVRNRRLEVNRQINRRAEQMQREHQAELTRIAKEGEEKRAQLVAQRRLRIQAYSQQSDITERDLESQRRSFRRYRNDPARDEQTNQFRRQLAEETQGQRNAIRERRQIQSEQKRLNDEQESERQREINRARRAEAERRSYDPRILGRNIDPRQVQNLPTSLRNDIELDIQAQNIAKRRQLDSEAKALYDKQKAEKASQLAESKRQIEQQIGIQQRLFDQDVEGQKIQIKNQQVSNRTVAQSRLNSQQQNAQVKDFENISERVRIARGQINEIGQRLSDARKFGTSASVNEIRVLEAEQSAAIRGYQALRIAEERFLGRSGGAGGSGGVGVPRGGYGGLAPPRIPRLPTGPPQGLINEKGFFTSADALGRITRNIILYEVVSRATYGLVEYVQASIQAAKVTSDYANSLRFATEQAGGNLEKNRELAESLQSIGVSRQQGLAALAAAQRFAENRPEGDARALSQTVANIAAARGYGPNQADELIDQLRRRDARFYKNVFGRTVESIYQGEAATAINKRTTSPTKTPGLFIGINKNEIESQSTAIERYVNSMDDAQKEQAVLNYILSQSARFQGEAAERANTLAGRLDKLDAAWTNNKETLGFFITDLKVVSNLVDYLSGKVGVFESLRAPVLHRTGVGGTISEADIRQYGVDRTTGPRASAINAIDTIGPTALLGGLGLVGAGLLGRRGAREQVSRETYNKVLGTAVTKFNGDFSAATQEAIFQAKQARPTIARSVSTGLQRVTIGLSNTIDNILASTADLVGARGFAGRARIRSGLRSGTVKPAGMTFDEFLAGQAEPSAVTTAGGVAGGVLGGYIGATIGNFVAERITSNQIVATGITILGGVAGTAIGTAAGGAVGGALTNLGIGAVGTAAGIGTILTGGLALGGLLGSGISSAFGGQSFRSQHIQELVDQAGLQRAEAEASAYRQQVQERQDAQREGRIRYRVSGAGPGDSLLTGRQVADRGISGSLLQTEILGKRDPRVLLKTIEDIDAAIIDTKRNWALSGDEIEKQTLDLENQKRILREYGTTDEKQIKELDDYRKEAAQRETERKEKERQQREKDVAEIGNALGKLRDATQGSFRIVGDVATSLVGEDNPYTKVLSEQITLAERMQQQWGFLGQAAVNYFSTVENRAINRQFNRLEYQGYQTASGFRGQAAREEAQRFGPGTSKNEENYLNIQREIVNQAIEVPKLWAQAALALGRTVSPMKVFRAEINAILRDYKEGTGAQDYRGLGQTAKQQINETYADAILGLGDAKQFRSLGLGNLYANASLIKAQGFQTRIEDARKKALFDAQENDRLEQQLREDEAFRNRQVRVGRDVRDVGREADALLLARTEGISPKDLTYQQFADRQAALRRSAERVEAERQEAKAAVQQGLEYQKQTLDTIQQIRGAIVSGNLQMLIQVQNDTQARIDQEALQDLSTNGVPSLDQGAVKSNPYTDSLTRYGRGGRKR